MDTHIPTPDQAFASAEGSAPPRDRDAASLPAPSRWRGAIAGLVAALVALGLAELIAGLSSVTRSPILDVGDRIIDIVPGPVKDLAISLFGTADKIALLAGIGIMLAAYAVVVGIVAVRRPVLGVIGVGLFGVVGALAALGEGQPLVAALPSVIGAVGGSAALIFLVRRSRPEVVSGEPAEHLSGASRRSFFVAAGALTVAAAAMGGAGRRLDSRFSATASRASAALPAAAERLPALPAGSQFDIPGLGPFVTPNADFYRIDTALAVPQVPTDTYKLKVTGMVDRPFELSYADLVARDLVEADITMTCVSNEVGGRLVGHARWLGLPLAELLDEAGVAAGADQIVGRSVDGYTCGFPVDVATDGRMALVAVGMNGEPLPLEHGFPVRLVVPGLYGYVSATKWLSEIELTTFDAFDHYWVRRGWATEAPIKTQSRIDTPAALASIPAGPRAIAGVAWAQPRGIAKV
jgi:DMSO/TMAO reductase YedYZ molybdopterin-dependent catalytic subunit